MKVKSSDQILDELTIMFPDAKTELNYQDGYQLLVAVMLSAQSTDVVVNQITPNLFATYPTFYDLSLATSEAVAKIIKRIGLYKTKAKNLVAMAQIIVTQFDSKLPNTQAELMSLPGVGPKTANVVLSEWFKIPAIAVDTHVFRVAKRLRLAPEDANVAQVEVALNQNIKKERWNQAHHLLILFGRYKCKARQPLCDDCPFFSFCRYQNPDL